MSEEKSQYSFSFENLEKNTLELTAKTKITFPRAVANQANLQSRHAERLSEIVLPQLDRGALATLLGPSQHSVWNASPTGVSGVPFRPRIQSVPEAATNDVAKAGVSHRRMSRSRRLDVAVPEESTRECDCRHRCGVLTPDCQNFHEVSSWRATCGGTGVCHIRHRRYDTPRIATGDGVTLL
ncbi:unnamed protein product [Ixodes persulcatus]